MSPLPPVLGCPPPPALNCPDDNRRIVVGSTVGGLVSTAVLVLLVARAFGYDFLTKQYTITNFYSLAEQKLQVWTSTPLSAVMMLTICWKVYQNGTISLGYVQHGIQCTILEDSGCRYCACRRSNPSLQPPRQTGAVGSQRISSALHRLPWTFQSHLGIIPLNWCCIQRCRSPLSW
jgi:hypothetical protein